MEGEDMSKHTVTFVLCITMIGMIYPAQFFGEEKQQKLDKKARAKVHQVLTIDLDDGIEKALSEPIEIIREDILTSVEQNNGITIDRASMIRMDKCLHDLLSSIPHLAKISAGNKIIRASIELNATTSQKSVWSKWASRKLEHPEVKMTLFYDNKAVDPTKIVCFGDKYH